MIYKSRKILDLTRIFNMSQAGFEPVTHGLEGRCSIQLSYWDSNHFQ